MTDMAPNTHPPSTIPDYFIIPGVSLKAIRKELKLALPKKRQESSSTVLITALPASVKIAIAGAVIELPAVTSGPFMAELPYVQFKFILTDPFDDGALFKCEFSSGSFSFNGLVTRSSQIMYQPGAIVEAPALQASAEAASTMSNPLDATVGLPLLAAYVHLRKYGINPLAVNKTFVSQQMEVDKLLKTVDRMLRPIGITRSDLESLLDRRAGIV
jgi:hypothetical protein